MGESHPNGQHQTGMMLAGERSPKVRQKRTSHWVGVMSALPPKADIGSTCQDVRFVPKADIDSATSYRLDG
jgi:hypothetical protein